MLLPESQCATLQHSRPQLATAFRKLGGAGSTLAEVRHACSCEQSWTTSAAAPLRPRKRLRFSLCVESVSMTMLNTIIYIYTFLYALKKCYILLYLTYYIPYYNQNNYITFVPFLGKYHDITFFFFNILDYNMLTRFEVVISFLWCYSSRTCFIACDLTMQYYKGVI